MTYYNSAALYGGRNPIGGCGFNGGYNIYEEDYSGGWDIGPTAAMVDSDAIQRMGASVIANAELTPRQNLLIRWWQTTDGGSVPIEVINFAFGLVKLFDSLRARALTADPTDRRRLAEQIAALRLRLFGEKPGSKGTDAQKRLYKYFLKAQKMIHKKPSVDKVRARKWMLNPAGPYIRGSWYKALPTPKRTNPERLARWEAIRGNARGKLDAWKAFYEANRPPGTRKSARKSYSAWSPRTRRFAANYLPDLPGALAAPPVVAGLVRPPPATGPAEAAAVPPPEEEEAPMSPGY